jgi:hypothetical protein
MPAKTSATAVAKAGVQLDESVSTQMKKLGVCTTCRHLDRCLFVKAARQPIWSCEEFDDSGAATAGSARPVKQPTPANLGEGQPEGLCADCDVRTDCAKRRPGEVITECADYH